MPDCKKSRKILGKLKKVDYKKITNYVYRYYDSILMTACLVLCFLKFASSEIIAPTFLIFAWFILAFICVTFIKYQSP